MTFLGQNYSSKIGFLSQAWPKLVIILIAVLFLEPQVIASHAQIADESQLTCGRIFKAEEFNPETFGPIYWLKDGSGYTILEQSQQPIGSREIVRYDLETGRRSVLVSTARLVPAGDSTPLSIAAYVWSPDEKSILIMANSKRVMHKTFGNYWVLDLKNGTLHKLGGKAEPSSLLNAKFSPDGQKVAYVYKNNIFVENLAGHNMIQLTMDGAENIYNGIFDHPYEEEGFNVDGFLWSPDSQSIAYYQLNSEKVPTFYMINNTDSQYPKIVPFKWTMPGEQNPDCRIGIVSASGGKTLWFQVPGDPANHYIQHLNWLNGEEVIFQHLNRLQNTNELMQGDARSGQVRLLFTDHDEKWLVFVRDLHWLDKGGRFTWVNEKDGWRHVYVVPRSGRDMKLITPGDFDVISIVGIDDKGGWLYYIASQENPTQQYLYRVPLDGSGKAERLTPAGQKGTHGYVISPDARWAFQTHSTFNAPPVTKLVRLPEHKEVRTVVDNAKLREKLEKLKLGESEFFRVDIGGGVELDAYALKPPDFNPQKKYPVLFYIYGEPMGPSVTDRWGGSRHLWHRLLTQLGYVVMAVDNRGINVPRGAAWRKIIYRQVGILASADQAAAIKAIIKRWNFVDPERIGIWGHSGGGAMTLNMMFRYPDLFRMGMASAPVVHQRYYDSIYQERFMGLPKDNPEGYEKGSPLNFAGQLKGQLLIVHGTGDHNVHYQNAEMLINELFKHNKPFTLMSYPNRDHGLSEAPNTPLHRHETMTRYLQENLPAGAK